MGAQAKAFLVQSTGYMIAGIWLVLLSSQAVVYNKIGEDYKQFNPDSDHEMPFNVFILSIAPRAVLSLGVGLPLAVYFHPERLSWKAVLYMQPISFLTIGDNLLLPIGSVLIHNGTIAYS